MLHETTCAAHPTHHVVMRDTARKTHQIRDPEISSEVDARSPQRPLSEHHQPRFRLLAANRGKRLERQLWCLLLDKAAQ